MAETSIWTTEKIKSIQRLPAQATEYIRTRVPKIYSRELVEVIFTQPYCRIQNVVDLKIAKRQTASVYLKTLESIGVLREVKVGREKLFIHPNFVHLLISDDHPVRSYGTAH
ncbi:MAG TPA: hypothetical protein VGE08_25930 [Steroidobacter sp.]|uniref:hypothetical protein n=1 Tax=Steroidobacter sp. TaxID=1978227 RepID=UPI002ED9F81A